MSMSENSQKSEVDRKKQTADLITLLDDLDKTDVPQLKAAVPASAETTDIAPTVAVVSTPSFLSAPIPTPEVGSAPATGLAPISDTSSVPVDPYALPSAPAIVPLPPVPTVSGIPSKYPPNFLETEIATGELFPDLQIFFKQLGKAFGKRYQYWEGTLSNILMILRKMQQNTQENAVAMVKAVEIINEKLRKGLTDFLAKRDEVERYAECDYKQVARNLKRTLELLNFQVREFKLQQMTAELYNIYK